ncbi:MAG: pyridoxal-phosphate dependent enzyme [Chloroflexota bacterium]
MREQLTEEYIRRVWDELPAFVKPTTFHSTLLLNQALDADVTLASETLQITGSFKFRAAYNLLREVESDEVITTSSGNFGQAVAYACMLLGKRCTVMMPANSSKSKQANIRSYDGEVLLIDTATKSRQLYTMDMLADHPDAFYAPPYDHYRVVAGNSTLGREIFEHFGPGGIDYVLCPIGGGGLISGIITARDILAPDVEIVGVEPLLGNDAAQSLRVGHIVTLDAEPQTMADGTRTPSVGKLNWEIIKGGLKQIIEVPEEKIAAGLQTLYSKANLKVEPTGALTTGAVLTQPEQFKGKRVCLIVSGGNVDVDVYMRVLGEE